MTAPGSNYSVTCWPGRHATSFPQEIRPGQMGLVIRLAPVDMVITAAPFPDGPTEFARWLRQLSRAAGHVATEVEQTARDATMPRHYVDEQSEQDSDTQGGDRGWPTA